MDTTKPTLNADYLYRKLNEKIAGRVEVQQRITAHIRARTGHATLPSFHNNGAPDQEKVALYSECLKAVLTGNYAVLAGQESISRDALADEEMIEFRPIDPVTGERVTKPVQPSVATPAPAPIPSAQPPNDLAAVIAKAIEPMIKPRSELDEAKVESIADKCVRSALTELEIALNRKIDEALETAPKPNVIAFNLPDAKETRVIEGAVHRQLPQVTTWVAANVPLWLWGQAGGGKTHMVRQVAEALSLAATVISVDPTMTVGKLLGFRNLATGEFVEGFLYRPFRDGGVVLIDEIDTGDPGILAALNALLANDCYLFPNGETVLRHADFRVLAGANTKGCGAVAGYTARNRLDAATLDRFAVLELAYDADLELTLATGRKREPQIRWEHAGPLPDTDETVALFERWVAWVQKVRQTVGNSVLVSPRASILGCRALRAGIGAAEVADALVFKLVSPDTKRNILNTVGVFNG